MLLVCVRAPASHPLSNTPLSNIQTLGFWNDRRHHVTHRICRVYVHPKRGLCCLSNSGLGFLSGRQLTDLHSTHLSTLSKDSGQRLLARNALTATNMIDPDDNSGYIIGTKRGGSILRMSRSIQWRNLRVLSWFCDSSRLVLELMIPPTPGWVAVVATHTSRVRESPGLVFPSLPTVGEVFECWEEVWWGAAKDWK